MTGLDDWPVLSYIDWFVSLSYKCGEKLTLQIIVVQSQECGYRQCTYIIIEEVCMVTVAVSDC